MNQYAQQTLLLTGSRLLERAAYYGFRAVLVIFMVKSLEIPRDQALEWYAYFTISTYLAQLIGGVIGDFVLGHRWSIVAGGALQMAGFGIISIGIKKSLIPGMILLSLGIGLFTSNSIAGMGRLYLSKPKKSFAAFTAYYTVVNLGAFTGVYFLSELTNSFDNMQIAMWICGGLVLVASVIGYFVKSKYNVINNVCDQPIGGRFGFIVLAVVILAIFWAGFELMTTGKMDVVDMLNSNEASSVLYDYEMYINSGIIIIGGIFAILLWYYRFKSVWLNIAIGLILGAIGVFILWLFMSSKASDLIVIIIASIVLTSLAELILVPAYLVITSFYSNPKYLGTILGAIAVVSMLLIKLFTYATSSIKWLVRSPSNQFIACASVFAVLGVLCLFFIRAGIPKNTVVQQDEILMDETDILDQQ